MNRNIDKIGRIVIPKEIRKKLNINEETNLTITLENEKIILTKDEPNEYKKRIDKALELLDEPYNRDCVQRCLDVKKALIGALK